MADTDDGYTRIANELLEAILRANLTARQLKIAFAIIRKTYGFGKKTDRITNTQISSMTGIHHTHVCTAKNEMIMMNIIVTSGTQIGINKVVSDWNCDISQGSETLAKSANKSLAKSANKHSPTQLNTKETIQKKERNIPQTHAVGLSLEEKLTPRQKGTNPRAKGTNPRSAMPAFDRERLRDTWNCKADKHGLPKNSQCIDHSREWIEAPLAVLPEAVQGDWQPANRDQHVPEWLSRPWLHANEVGLWRQSRRQAIRH
nr:replication protein [Serratia sp. SCBI]